MTAACTATEKKPEVIKENDRPNILWLFLKDASPTLAPYGDATIEIPNINHLAEKGITYTSVFFPSGVCSLSRASLASGLYSSPISANHMRTTSHPDIMGLPAYEAVPPPHAKMLSQVFAKPWLLLDE